MGLPKGNVSKRVYGKSAWEDFIKTSEGKKLIEDWRTQDIVIAMLNICLFALEWLEMKHRYKKNGLEKFMKHFIKGFESLKDDEKYFAECLQYYKDTYDLDIAEWCGATIDIDTEVK